MAALPPLTYRDDRLAAHYRQAYFASTYGEDSVAPMRKVRRPVILAYPLGAFASDDEAVEVAAA